MSDEGQYILRYLHSLWYLGIEPPEGMTANDLWMKVNLAHEAKLKDGTAAERARLLTVIAEIEGEFGPYPLREQKELIAQFRAAIKEATNGI